MALVNIPRDRDDPNYRYKMPKLISKIEGRGNGIKTNISNMGEISRALKRPPMYPTKFFGCELGAMAKFEEAEEKALVNGAHKESDLVTILDKFIQMYVLCPGCELPEIDINVKKGLLTCKCNACGYVGSLDNVHKAATYMVRNPPDAGSSTMGKKKKSKEERRAEKQQQQREKKDRGGVGRKGKSVEEEDNEDKEGEEGEDKPQDNGEEEAAGSASYSSNSLTEETATVNGTETQSTKKSHTERGGDITPTNDDDSESWDEHPQEKSRETRRSKDRREKRSSGAAEADKRLLQKEALVFDSPELQDVIDRLRNLLVKHEKVDLSLFFQELRMLQVSQDFDAKCRIYVTLGALFKDGITPESLEKRMAYISKVVDSSVSAGDVLDALGYFCYEQGIASLTNFPYFLQKLYNAEILEADDILKYYRREKAEPLYTACRKHAGPFLEWLREDEEEEDEDEEEKFFSSGEDEDAEDEEEEEEEDGEKGIVKGKRRENGDETAARGKGSKEKPAAKKREEAKKGEDEAKTKKSGVKGRAEKDDDDEEEEEKGKTGKGEKKNKNNNSKKDATDASQTEETGSGGEKAKGNGAQRNGGGKGKKREKK